MLCFLTAIFHIGYRNKKWMSCMKKIAVSLPETVLATVNQLAERRGESRSHLIATILERVARAKRDRDITTQINALLADEGVSKEQKQTTDAFLRISPWSKEKW